MAFKPRVWKDPKELLPETKLPIAISLFVKQETSNHNSKAIWIPRKQKIVLDSTWAAHG